MENTIDLINDFKIPLQCFKLNYDAKNQSSYFPLIVNTLTKYGDMIQKDGHIFIYLRYPYGKSDLLKALRRVGVVELYCEPIRYEDIENDQDFFAAWYKRQYELTRLKLFEIYNQPALRQMINNINNQSDKLDQMYKEAVEKLKSKSEN